MSISYLIAASMEAVIFITAVGFAYLQEWLGMALAVALYLTMRYIVVVIDKREREATTTSKGESDE